jgi:hypothetical protein
MTSVEVVLYYMVYIHFESEKVGAHLYPTSETWHFTHEPLVSIKGGVFDKLHILSTSHEGLRSMS